MKSILPVIVFACSFCFLETSAQDTFSIVAADSTTREVGSAGASCVDLFSAGLPDATFLGQLLPDTGAINTQASYHAVNQNNARSRMRAGDSPDEIITWLDQHDVSGNPTVRQYGIVGFSGSATSAAGYTGTNCLDYKNHITGSIDGIYYSIQGNILLDQSVLDSMESRFRNATVDLTCRLMAAMQGAKVIGADTRCAPDNTSSLFAYLKVSQPGDPYGSPSFSISVRTHDNTEIEPIDSLQQLFDAQVSCMTSGLQQIYKHSGFEVYPNPASDEIIVKTNPGLISSAFMITDSSGKQIKSGTITHENFSIDIHFFSPGIYFIQVGNHSRQSFVKKG